jgi:hypothetical protein
MTLWSDTEGNCWSCCLASLVGVHPDAVPSADHGLDLEEQNEWLASRGYQLEPVWPRATWGESFPRGKWIALRYRAHRLGHAVIAEAGEIVHDPGLSNGWSGTLWPSELAHVRKRELPLGFELVEVP